MTRTPPLTFHPMAFLLAVVLPGLGHCALGELRRGILVGTGILGLFLSGIFVGGIDVIDRREDKWWFVLQAGVGPVAFAVDSVHQRLFKVTTPSGQRMSAHPDPDMNPGGKPPANLKSLGRVNEVGSLFTALAGMMNMIAIIDASWYRRRSAR